MTPTRTGFERDATTRLAYLVLGFYVYIINGVGPILPGLRADLGLSYSATSLHGTFFALGSVLVGLAGDRVIDRLGRRGAVRLGIAASVGGALIVVLAPSLAVSLPAMLLVGSVGGLLLVLPSAILSDRHGDRRAAALGEASAVASLAGTIAPLLVGVSIAFAGSWRLGFVLPPLLLALPLVAASRSVPLATAELRPPPDPPDPADHPDDAAPRGRSRLPRAYWRHWLTIVLVVAIEWCFVYWIAAYLAATLGIEPGLASGSVAFFLGGMVLGRVVGARIALRHAAERLLLAGLGLTAVGFVCFWAALAFPLSVAGLLVAGTGVAMLFPLALGQAIATVPDAADLATTRGALASGIAIGSAPFVLGAAADVVGLRAAYLVVALLIGVATWGVLLAGRAARPGPPRARHYRARAREG